MTAGRIYVAGHAGMVGRAIYIRLLDQRAALTRHSRHGMLDLRLQRGVENFFAEERPTTVIVAAARVGGIKANQEAPVEFLYDNLAIATNIIHAAHRADVQRLIFLGSSCMYPRIANQPMVEHSLFGGHLEHTNEWYALAKLAGMKLCDAYRKQHGRDYFTVIPPNLYGPNDNFDLETSHVVPALIRKFHEAKVHDYNNVEVWGSGWQLREFMHVDDLAAAILFLLELGPLPAHALAPHSAINVGCDQEVSIFELVGKICEVTGYVGHVSFNHNESLMGVPRKILSSDRIRSLGWTPKISLDEGLNQTYAWYLEQLRNKRPIRGLTPDFS